MTSSLTRVVTLHARHHFLAGGPTQPHGHLYRVEVTVRGTIDSGHSRLIDLPWLDDLLATEIVAPLAGTHINQAIAEFSDGAAEPSCEALAAWCWHRIAPRLQGVATLERVRVGEDATLWADCTGMQ